ncbi:cytochrome c biogenesis protein ResB [Nocardioides bruguierae]|uniref:Cytochrome c biogenesis protein ResB n=1 Tax=Nocardioides bruguierae TaxID=2945102 RepID=A0A9X2IHF2_9ACTN|nr:cytochrome c biogenesis protein ResB [Nocardioides bruguierae]MCM0621730.1 cytochrome c biogenesis protein ResB [Nocardioides bruguierae]
MSTTEGRISDLDPSEDRDAPASSSDGGDGGRRPGDLGARELGRWAWRQLTSMRTALILLLLLALAAIPGSIIPQEDVDSLAASNWKDAHETLAPIYEKLGLFAVYDSPWFAAIYVLLMISLVGCILPRTKVYWRGLRAQPPRAPRHLTRLPEHASFVTDRSAADVHEAARALLRSKRYRVRGEVEGESGVSAERGYLREAGNLVFHLAILVVLVGFAMGSLFGYQGAVIVINGKGFSNNLTQYDDFNPGTFFSSDDMEPFSFDVDDFDVEWIMEGRGAGQSQGYSASLTYSESPTSEEQTYDLRVNHPLDIGDTEVFLVGHGYAPIITVTDGNGDVAWSGPTIFLPQDASLLSFGVVKARTAEPEAIGLEGLFYPTYVMADGDPINVMGDDLNPTLSMLAYVGDLGLEDGQSQSVYVLDKSNATQLTKDDGSPLRLDMQVGDSIDLPDGLGTVTFDGVEPWVRVQISQTPGKLIALGGVVLMLIGVMGSLFIRPRRAWVRARETDDGTVVELAVLDRSGGGDVSLVLADIVGTLRADDDRDAPAADAPAPTTPTATEDDSATKEQA